MNRTRLLQYMRTKALGQSLVETALFLPIILFLLAGVLEISNMLITQNRVQTAARVGTGFGATNYNETLPVTATFEAMSMVALNNVTETLELTPERWDIYTVKATLNTAGDDFTEWTWGHPYGADQVFAESDWAAEDHQNEIKNDILDALDSSANGLEIVSTISYHNRDSFVGLGYFNPGLTRIRGLTVMRISDTEGSYAGCDLFPITLHVENMSLYPDNYTGTMETGGEMFDSDFWMSPGNTTHSVSNLAYDDGPPRDHSGFPFAHGGHRLDQGEARRGDIFEAREGTGPGNFGWLSWDGTLSAPALEASLHYPGNLTLRVPPPDGKVNYVNPYDADDHVPNIGDWVQGTTGNLNSNAVRELLDEGLIDTGRQIQIIVFDQVTDAGGSNFNYRIAGFVLVKLRARNTGGSEKQILVEFIEWAEPCIDPNPYP